MTLIHDEMRHVPSMLSSSEAVDLVFRRHNGVTARGRGRGNMEKREKKRRSAAEFETAQAGHVLGWRNSKPPAKLI
jgi:hypothetical protein